MKGQISEVAKDMTLVELQHHDSDDASTYRTKNAWLRVQKCWIKARVELMDLSDYIKMREKEVLVTDNLSVAINMIGTNMERIVEMIQDKLQWWPCFVADEATYVYRVIVGMRKEWNELSLRSARDLLGKVVSPVSCLAKHMKVVRKVREMQRLTDTDKQQYIAMSGVPVVRQSEGVVQPEALVFATPGQMEKESDESSGVFDVLVTPPKLTTGEEEWLKKMEPKEIKTVEEGIDETVLQQFLQDYVNSDAERRRNTR
jgi:hypothetical protein